jgi:hypothetical protein
MAQSLAILSFQKQAASLLSDANGERRNMTGGEPKADAFLG